MPVEIAKILVSHGELPVALTVCSDPEKMVGLADPILNLGKLKLSLGLKMLKENNVDRVIMAGKIPNKSIYSPSVFLDPTSLKIFMTSRKDDHSLLESVVSWLDSEGIKVLPYASYIAKCVAPEGIISTRAPNDVEKKDIEHGEKILKAILPFSFGQSIAVADEAILAVEAMEGTDGMILRSGELLREKMAKRNGTVVKMMWADQDERYDLPTIGPGTIESVHKAGLSCIAVESGRTLIMEYDKVLEKAERYDIAIWGLKKQIN